MGAAESVWAMVLCESAASASERVFGVRPEGVVGVKLPVDGGSSSESPMVVYVWECGVTFSKFLLGKWREDRESRACRCS